MSQAGGFGSGVVPVTGIETLSGENGSPQGPSGVNFNFSGSTAGGSSSNGAVLFSSTASGEMNAAVQVDNTTIIINASNQLQVVSTAFTWSNKSASFAASANNGYFVTANSTATLPASPTTGATIAFIVTAASDTLTITANTGQTLQISSATSASAGTAVNTAQGDTMYLVYDSTSTKWFALNFVGNWTVT